MLACLLTLLLAALTATASSDWTGFRGPNGSGIADGAALPTEFGSGKNRLWMTAVPFGRSSPIVVRHRVFLTASDGDTLITLALDRRTGAEIWRRHVQRARHMPIYKGNDPASPSPASDGDNVYVFFAEIGLISYTIDGRERWRVPLGPFVSFYGMGGSPIVDSGVVVLVCDQRTGSYIIAVDSRTGKTRWKQDRSNPVEGFTTPVIYRPAKGTPQVIVFGSAALDAYDLTTGERLWWVRQVGGYPKGVPALGSDMVFVSAQGSDKSTFPTFDESLQKSDANKDGLIQLAEAQKGHADAAEHFGWIDTDRNGAIDRTEYDVVRAADASGHGITAIRLQGPARDGTEARIAWRIQKQYPNVPSPLLYRGILYTVKEGGIVMSIEPSTGRILKTGRLEGALDEYYASPVAGDGKIFLTSATGKVSVLRAGPQWEVIGVNDLGEDAWATPAIADGTIFVRTRGALHAFAARAPRSGRALMRSSQPPRG